MTTGPATFIPTMSSRCMGFGPMPVHQGRPNLSSPPSVSQAEQNRLLGADASCRALMPIGLHSSRVQQRGTGPLKAAFGLVFGASVMVATVGCELPHAGTGTGSQVGEGGEAGTTVVGGNGGGITGGSGGGIGGIGGSGGGTGGIGGGGGDVATPPIIVNPSQDLPISNPNVYVSLQDGQFPVGFSAINYPSCVTQDGISSIDEPGECPNPFEMTEKCTVLSFGAGQSVHAKASAHLGDGETIIDTDHSEIRAFMTDHALAHLWKFDEGAGTTAFDSIGTSDGTLIGVEWIDGISNGAVLFGGGNQNVLVSNPPNYGLDGFSIEGWVWSYQSDRRQKIVSGDEYDFAVEDTGRLSFNGITCGVIASVGDVLDGDWHHVAVTRGGADMALYLDGEVVGTVACADDFSNTSTLYLGGDETGNDTLAGKIDELAIEIHGTPMTPEQLQERVNNSYKASWYLAVGECL